MANLYFSLPIVANGVGAPVDVSAAGAEKTIVVQGTSVGIVTIEISCDAGVSWCELYTFFGTGKKVISFAANRMRVRQAGTPTAAPFTLEVDVGANDNGGNFVTIPPPPANGTGATVNITALGSFTTLIAQGTFGGGVIGIQISENGIDFAECATFSAAGCESKSMVGDFARAVSRGAKPGVPFAPVLSMGAINDDNSDDLTVEDEGIVVGVRPILNFIGPTVTAVDDPGNNRVNVTITASASAAPFATWGNANVAASADTRFCCPGRDNSLPALTTDVMGIPVTKAGTLRNLIVRHNTAAGNGNNVVYTVYVNGVATAITVTLATAAVGQATDVTHTVAVVVGDRVSLARANASAIGSGAVDMQASLEIGY